MYYWFEDYKILYKSNILKILSESIIMSYSEFKNPIDNQRY